VIDFGCGEGRETLDLVRLGASKAIGVDIRPAALQLAKERARAAGVADRCDFVTATDALADIVISLDAFEHFDDPAAILKIMHGLLKPGGRVLASFGPTWYHPLGGHLFSVFPWAHLIFSEAALIQWRSHIRADGATRFREVEGGLNRMTIREFERLVAKSNFSLESLQPVPIARLRPIHCRLTREFTTAVVRATLLRLS
jgi:SAM-dependent methyltransferase